MKSQETKGERVTRRQLLRLVALSAVGAAIVLSSRRLAATALPAPSPSSSTTPATLASAASSNAATGAASSPATVSSSPSQETTVKVVYFQMPFAVNVKEEHFALQSPAHYRDLLPLVLQEHPALSPMMPTMMVLIDGVPAQPDAPLRDGDEVDFIPAIAGG